MTEVLKNDNVAIYKKADGSILIYDKDKNFILTKTGKGIILKTNSLEIHISSKIKQLKTVKSN